MSYLDIVAARPAEDSSTFDFVRVIKRSGHSTYMLLLQPDEPATQEWWSQLQQLGCSYEGAALEMTIGGMGTLYSVDVPPAADHAKIYDLIIAGMRGAWHPQVGYGARTTPSSAGQS